MSSWVMGLFRKMLNIMPDFGEERCAIHPQVGTKNVDTAIYWAVDEYTNAGYIKVAEDLSRLKFLTIIDRSPLTFQVGTSNVTISPERDGNGIIFHSTMVIRRPKSFADLNGFLKFERQGAISFEEAFELMNERDQEDVLYALDVLNDSS